MLEEKKAEILIVGAGSIGRVYGYHLWKGGANIHYYVRDHNKQNLTNYPLRMHKLSSSVRWFNKSETKKFSDYNVITDNEIKNNNVTNLPSKLDYVIFTIPPHFVNKGEWFKTLVSYLNNKYQKKVYYSSPAPDITGMKQFIDVGIDKNHLISGQIACDCYYAPIDNQSFEARGIEMAKKDDEENNPNKVIVYYQSGQELFGELTSEAKDATDKLAIILNQGGLNAKSIGRDTEYGLRFPIMTSMFMSYTIYNWNFAEVAKHFPIMSLVTGSFREIATVVKKKTNNQCGFPIKAMSYIPTARLTSFLFCPFFYMLHLYAKYISSFDIEALGNSNYNGKLREQTSYIINNIYDDAKKNNIKLSNFNKLVEKFELSQKTN